MTSGENSPYAGYADLHVHSHYSYRDGVSSIEELVAAAVELGRPALALTDHGHAAGYVELQESASRLGLANPIFGVDMPVEWPDDNLSATAPEEWAGEGCGSEAQRLSGSQKGGRCHNLVLLARDETGLQNLFKLLTWAGTTGYDKNNSEGPLLAPEILLEHTQGLAVLSGGPGGQLSRLLAAGLTEQTVEVAARYREAFGPYFYLELVANGSPLAQADRARLVAFARQHSLPLLATGDVHYVRPEQARARDLLWAIADNVRLNDPKRRHPAGDDARPLPVAELVRRFAEVPEALENAAMLAEACQVRLPKSTLIIPSFPVPAEFDATSGTSGRSAAGLYLENICRESLNKRYGSPLPSEMEARLAHELGVIERAGFARYILIVADIVREAHANDILCAPRGSSAGSLVCYACGITPLNPLDFGLLFERFLNEARLAPPDIDLDIADEARPRLLEYVVRRYGAENVAHITTYNFEGAKSALRDAGKALGSDPFLVNRLVSLVPIEFQRPYTLSRTLAEEPETARLYKKEAAARDLIDHALLIEGTGRNSGTHAAGVVITPNPIAGYVPLTRTEGLAQQQRGLLPGKETAEEGENGTGGLIKVMTQWNMEDVEKRGLLKVDLLGLTAWSTIGHALAFIKQLRGEELDVWNLPKDDTATFQMLSQGYTLGVFQLENQGMTEFTTGMKPQSIADLALMIAAYRPGPMPFLGKLLAVRHGREPLSTPHPLLNPIMAETYGVPVYQETMLKIAQEVAGYSLGEADVLRKAIGKKNQKELEAQQAKFTAGALERGLSIGEANAIWEMFPPFAFYGFNQAHAIIYGYLTYITAYLKLHYSLEYLGALLTVAGGDTEAVVKAVSESRRLHVPLLGPDVNRSEGRLTIDRLPDGAVALRFGLSTVKGLGPAGVEAIEAARRSGGPFTGLADFIRRVPGRSVNSRTLTALARVGAFPFGSRAEMEALIPAAQKAAKAKTFAEPAIEPAPEYPLETLLSYEHELLGVHLTPIPVAETVAQLEASGRVNASTLTAGEAPDNLARVGGAVTGGREIQSRYGLMYVFNLNDGRGLLEISVFPRLYRENQALLKEGKMVVVEGKPEKQEGRVKLQAQRLESA
ncbi:MAG TPA: DNA polymerase III subunit alpha [Chloroflexia bacterium]|nr:DNA polymerase III subunit alpha [Chloroflexia bacterium]